MEYIAKWVEGTPQQQDAYDLRLQVFVDEQGFAREVELDEIDRTAWHLVLYAPDGTPAAVGRTFPAPGRPGTYTVGRICVAKSHRRSGLGARLLDEIHARLRAAGAKTVQLHAQVQVQPFYQRCGYTAVGSPFIEDGWPHITMQRPL